MDCAFDGNAFDPVAFDVCVSSGGTSGYAPVSFNRPKIIYVFDDRKQRREDEEILFL